MFSGEPQLHATRAFVRPFYCPLKSFIHSVSRLRDSRALVHLWTFSKGTEVSSPEAWGAWALHTKCRAIFVVHILLLLSKWKICPLGMLVIFPRGGANSMLGFFGNTPDSDLSSVTNSSVKIVTFVNPKGLWPQQHKVFIWIHLEGI